MSEASSALTVRLATEEDCELILNFVKALAVYEKLEHLVVATPEQLKETIFSQGRAEVLLGEENGAPVAFALFFHNYSTFLGRAGLYLEDLFVRQECRGRGYGKAMFRELARIALERGCRRFEWSCLDWNTSSIEFYRHMGANPLEEWTIFRLEGEALEKLGGQG